MRILFISGRLGGGGSERVLVNLANEFYDNNYEVEILCFNQYDNNYNCKTHVSFLRHRKGFLQILNLRKFIKKYNPDCIISFEYYVAIKTILSCIGLNYRIIVSERNDPHKLDKKKIKSFIRNWCYKKSDVLVCQTDDARLFFESHGIKNCQVVLNPITSDLPLWNNKESNIIINYCRFEKQKNLFLLIDAVEELRNKYDIVLELYGEGSQKDCLIEYVKNKNMNSYIHIKPFNNKIHEIVSNALIFVSTSDYEGLSNSMIESMAIGIPVICTDCPIGGAKMLIKNHYNGTLVPVGQKKELVNEIELLLKNKSLREKYYINEIKIRDELALHNIFLKWEKLVSEEKK